MACDNFKHRRMRFTSLIVDFPVFYSPQSPQGRPSRSTIPCWYLQMTQDRNSRLRTSAIAIPGSCFQSVLFFASSFFRSCGFRRWIIPFTTTSSLLLQSNVHIWQTAIAPVPRQRLRRACFLHTWHFGWWSGLSVSRHHLCRNPFLWVVYSFRAHWH